MSRFSLPSGDFPSGDHQNNSEFNSHRSQNDSSNHGDNGDGDEGAFSDFDFDGLNLFEPPTEDSDLFHGRSLSPRLSPEFFVPCGYTDQYAYPLIVYLHGANSHPQEMLQVMPFVSLRNYLAVAVGGNFATDPDGLRLDWRMSSAGVDKAADHIFDAIAEAKRRYHIHHDRIILAGRESGGTMALKVAMEFPNRFAGAISIGGSMPSLPADLLPLRQRRLPMLWQSALHSEKFCQKQFQDDCRSAMMAKAMVEARHYTIDDEADRTVFRDIDTWIMQTVVNGVGAHSGRWDRVEVSYSEN